MKPYAIRALFALLAIVVLAPVLTLAEDKVSSTNPRGTASAKGTAIPAGETVEGKVTGVSDGDMLTLLVDKTQFKVRLAGIEAPTAQPFGAIACQALADTTLGKTVKVLSQGSDQYGRTLGVVFTEECVNTRLVRDGIAWYSKKYSASKVLAVAEEEARKARAGLWAPAKPAPLTSNRAPAKPRGAADPRVAAPPAPFKALVAVTPAAAGKAVSPLLYGNNTKWLYDGESHHKRDNGIWLRAGNCINPAVRDWLVEARYRILRYGDGTNGDFFYWGWSILPWEHRQANEVYTRWGAGEHYSFGVMEFISLAEEMGSEGIIIVNYPLGLLKAFYDPEANGDKRSPKQIAIQQAANWVEFMNREAPAAKDPRFPDVYKPEYSLAQMPPGYFAYLRTQLGRTKPFAVRYWEIGNEIDVFHTGGGRYSKTVESPKAIACEEYTRNAVDYARAMKAVDPAIKVGIVEWPTARPKKEDVDTQLAILKAAPGAIDFYIVHDYIAGGGVGKNPVFAIYGGNPVTRSFTAATSGKHTLRLHAWGRAYFGDKSPAERGVPPRVELAVDGAPLAKIDIDKNLKPDKSDLVPNQFEWYEIPVQLAAGTHTLTLRLVNSFFDRAMADMDRRARNVFMDALLLEKEGDSRDVFYPEPGYLMCAQTRTIERKLAGLSAQFAAARVSLFFAQTEGGVYPSSGDLAEALANAIILMVDMDQDVRLRTHFHLYGACDRSGVIHSGSAEQDAYHRTPAHFVFMLFGEHFVGRLVRCETTAPEVELVAAKSDLDRDVKEKLPLVQARACRTDDGVAVALVNCDTKRAAAVKITLKSFAPAKGILRLLATDDPAGFHANNETKSDNVVVRTMPLDAKAGAVTLPPSSFAMIELTK